MLSSHGLINARFLKPSESKISLELTDKTLDTLTEFKEVLEVCDNNIAWPHLEESKPIAECNVEELVAQFDLIDRILEVEYANSQTSKKRDQFKIALEHYKLAIMESTLNDLCDEKRIPHEKKPSRFVHGVYYFLFVGGSWIAYLHGYDAAQAILGLLPLTIPSALLWTAGSLLFLIALGLFIAFEAEELSKHMGFQFSKNLKTTLDINQRQIEVTHDLAKHLAIHSEKERVLSAENYETYVNLLLKFDHSINKTKERVSHFHEGPGRKAIKTSLLLFGMVFTAADEIFLTIGFGALALIGPWGWVVLGATALIGAILFYVAFHDMVRNKVAPVIKQKEEIIETYDAYSKDHLLEGIQKKLEMKKRVESLEEKLEKAEEKILQQDKIIAEKNHEIERLRSPMLSFSGLKNKVAPAVSGIISHSHLPKLA